MKQKLLLAAALFASFFTTAQTTISIQKSLVWSVGQVISPTGRSLEVANFDGADFDNEHPTWPVFSTQFPLSQNGRLEVELAAADWQSFEKKPAADDAQLSEKTEFKTGVAKARGEWFGDIRFNPIRKNGGQFERLVSFELRVRLVPEAEPTVARGPFTTTSVLNDGAIFKFGVSKSGVYKLSFEYLKNTLGISNLESIDPRTIKMYGNGGAMLPEPNAATRPDDLLENAVFISGEADGKFDGSDFLLFYSPGPDRWSFNPTATGLQFLVSKNLYADQAFYFLKISAGNGLRVADRADIIDTNFSTSESDDFKWLEDEKINLLDYSSTGQGSGKRWFGDQFKNDRSNEYADFFKFSDVNTSEPGRVRAVFAARCSDSTPFKLTAGTTVFSAQISGVNITDPEGAFAAEGSVNGSFSMSSGDFPVKFDYPPTGKDSEGFLDNIGVQVRRSMKQNSNQMEFRDQRTMAQPTATFNLAGASAVHEIWDVTDPLNPVRQLFATDASGLRFGCPTAGVLKNFISFSKNDGFLAPDLTVGKLENQNIHGLDNLDLAIVFHKDFQAQAEQLAAHRSATSGLAVATIDAEKLFNEFGGGAADPTAIRDFARMLYERNPLKFKYLCLFGDGSFDFKNLRKDEKPSGFVPVFETSQSYHAISAYPSDDFFALLDANEGGNIGGGLLDIGVGRLTVRTADEAADVVQKIVDYDLNPASLGDWRLRLIYAADDDDSNQHINQADTLAQDAERHYPIYNPEKIFLDAYQQVSTAGDDSYPEAKNAINSNVFKGGLVLNWIGHGGPRGWAQERVIGNSDIENWDNPKRLPLLITATCSFGGYDDPTTTTGGEQAFLKKNSGAIGLFTTVRAVFIGPNNKLTSAVADTIFSKTGGQNQAIGLILIRGKNRLGGDENSRRFTLIGDPSMQLAVPEYQVVMTEINSKTVAVGKKDTLQSLQPVVLKGLIRDGQNGQTLTNFNGTLFVTIFDKKTLVKTLGNDPGSYVRTFEVRKNIIFKGKASVKNGLWTVNFIVPKDIQYQFGQGKISFYAEDGTPNDAAGYYEDIIIGGTFANAVVDDTPPKVEVFMNDENFAFGGLTDAEPKIFARISDDKGINVTGASIGHDLTAVIDDRTANALILNDFYESAIDDATKGKAIYPLSKLEPGRHKVRVKAWDIANNSGEGETEFVVAESGLAALDHVLNYPNPFTTHTNFQFEHNLAGQVLHVQVQIFSVAGKLVKTLSADLSPDGYRVAGLGWDGLDDYGDQLAKGVYLYKIRVETAGDAQKLKAESEFERLVLLK